MPSVPVPITVDGDTYKVPGADTIEPLAVSVTFDGSSAAGAFLPCLSYRTQSGQLISRTFPASSVAAGSSAEVSFIPFVPPASGAASGGSDYVFIESKTADGTSDLIHFSSIPQTFKHLALEGSLGNNSAPPHDIPSVADFAIQWTTAPSSNYSWACMNNGNITTSSGVNDGVRVLGLVPPTVFNGELLPQTGFAGFTAKFPYYRLSDRVPAVEWQGSCLPTSSDSEAVTASGGGQSIYDQGDDVLGPITDIVLDISVAGRLWRNGSIVSLYGIN